VSSSSVLAFHIYYFQNKFSIILYNILAYDWLIVTFVVTSGFQTHWTFMRVMYTDIVIFHYKLLKIKISKLESIIKVTWIDNEIMIIIYISFVEHYHFDPKIIWLVVFQWTLIRIQCGNNYHFWVVRRRQIYIKQKAYTLSTSTRTTKQQIHDSIISLRGVFVLIKLV